MLSAILFWGVIFATPYIAHAGFFTDTTINVGVTLFKVVAYIINTLVGFLFVAAAWLVGLAMQINLTVASASNTIVRIGWGITRDIANLGFVLAMIVIAFATIIQYEAYGARKLLVKLITAAILVNFSLTIGGVFIDFSNVLTGFFLSKINVGPVELAGKLAQAFGPQKFFLGDTTDPLPPDPKNQPNIVEAIGWGALLSISGLIFSMAFLLISTIVLLTFAIMLIIRFVYLTILLASAPLSWLFSVIPQLQGLNNLWWSKFTQWTFFAPAMTFFIYLALAGADALAIRSHSDTFFSDPVLANIMSVGMQGILLSGTLIGGLMAAKKMGITGAEAGMGAAKGLWGGAKGFASERALMLRQRLAGAGAQTDKHGTTTSAAERAAAALGTRLRRVPFVGTSLSRGVERTRDAIGRDVEAGIKTKYAERPGLMGSLLHSTLAGAGIMKDGGKRKDENKTKEELLAERDKLKAEKELAEKLGTLAEEELSSEREKLKARKELAEERGGVADNTPTGSDKGDAANEGVAGV